VLVYGYYDFQNPPAYMDTRHLLLKRIAAAGTSFSFLPYQAWHGCGVTSARRVEVEVGADGLVSAPPPGPPPRRRRRAPRVGFFCMKLSVEGDGHAHFLVLAQFG
jgi:hypothetical protein